MTCGVQVFEFLWLFFKLYTTGFPGFKGLEIRHCVELVGQSLRGRLDYSECKILSIYGL